MKLAVLIYLMVWIFQPSVSIAPEYLQNAEQPRIFKNYLFRNVNFSNFSGNGINGYIVGGEEAVPNSQPHQVGMFVPSVYGGYWFCGGSIINARTVLTAAHCVDGRSQSQPVIVYFGAHNMPPTDSDEGAVMLTSNDTVMHAQYDSAYILNDIALVRFNESIPFSDKISAIQLPTDANKDYLGSIARASGWGRPSDSASSISATLRVVNASIISNYPCRLSFFGLVEDSNICTSGALAKGTCNGDSGGPLIIDDVLVGITSFGTSFGCEVGWPSVFTRVTYYLSWIYSNWATE